MRKLLLILLFSVLLIGVVGASPRTYKQGLDANLLQSSNSATFVNVTNIVLGDGTVLYLNDAMTKQGNTFNYTLSGLYTTSIGTYQVCGIGDDTEEQEFCYTFEVKGGNLGFFIIAFVLFFILTFYGMSIKNEWVSLIGCFGLLVLGIYTSFYGIDLYKNDLTRVISYVTIGIGLGIGFQALKEITYY